MSDVSPRALAAKVRATKRWYVYLILCRSGAIYTGIARNVAVRYAQHVAGTGARYTHANPPRLLLVKFVCLVCPNQSEASRMEAAPP
jgi:putative endonuclease